MKYERPELILFKDENRLTKGDCADVTGDVGNCSYGTAADGWCSIGDAAGACFIGNGR